MGETRKTYNVSLTSKDRSRGVEVFYKYQGEHLPTVGDVIGVVRFVRGRVIRARVTFIDANSSKIAATQID